jgi:two-component system chemotaxis sensor kinase CheA
MSQDPYRYFRVEARELLDQLGAATLELERRGGGRELVQRLLRVAHTLKGAARVVKQLAIADQAHAIEEALAPHRDRGERVPHETVDALLKLIDGVQASVVALEQQRPSAPEVADRGAAHDLAPLIRADTAQLDELVDGLTETHVQLSLLRGTASQVERANRLAELLAEQLKPRANRGGARAGTERAAAMAEDLGAMIGRFERTFETAIDQIERELHQVREAAEKLRLVSASSLFVTLERATRDAARALGKRVAFEGLGGDVRVDAQVLAAVQPPLVQLIRNAVAHGIEPEAERRARGKAPAGRVVVEIVRRGGRVVFGCRDDGAGVDVEAVSRMAAAKGLRIGGGAPPSADELAALLLKGGISTSAAVTEVAGRGVGLDVVREAVERLGGDVRVRTERGLGAAFDLSIPISLAAIEALAVESAGTVAHVPLDAVKRAVRTTPGELVRTSEGDCVVFDGRAIPFVTLPKLLRSATEAAAAATSVVIVESAGGTAALGVERLRGRVSVVLRPLPALTPADSIVAGASLDAEGNPLIVLEPEGIVSAAAEPAGSAAPSSLPRRPILVVDDSLTTRMLEQSILESAGYAVHLATSAEEGLEKAHAAEYALFLVDVEMPGMDGFSFVEHVRRDPALRATPAILVTSRSAAEDRERGRRAGAQGYIVKSDFDQSELLARIKQLVG